MGWGFSVTPEELARIGDRLDQVHDDLDSTEVDEGIQAYQDDLGHEGLAGTAVSFETNWSLRRHELAGELHRLAGLARSAARAYQQTDDAVGASFS